MFLNPNSRRQFLSFIPGVALVGVAGCSASDTLPAQILADAAGVVNDLLTLVPQVSAAAPSILSASVAATLLKDLNLAKTLLNSLSTSVSASTAATVLQQVEGYVSDALNALAAVIPAAASTFPVLTAFVLPIEAVASLLPVLVNFINSQIPPPSALKLTDKIATIPTMEVLKARQVLLIPIVS
jgi:hypothetical protein